jgi:hypothetical protein
MDHAEHELYLACALAVTILLFLILILCVLTRDVCSCRLIRHWTCSTPPSTTGTLRAT